MIDKKSPTSDMTRKLTQAYVSLTCEGGQLLLAYALAAAGRLNACVAIAVTDKAGQILCSVRMDEAPGVSIDLAARKAWTSAQLGVATAAIQQKVDTDRPAYLAANPLCPIAGGMPVRLEGSIVGAIGVSGSTEENDHAIAEEASKALGDDVSCPGI